MEVNSPIWPNDRRGLATAALGYIDFRFRFFVQSLEITVSLYQVYNLVFISIYVRISMNLVSKWPVPAWGTTHSLRPKGREWRILWASWHAVTGSNCHVRTGRCYRNCFFHVQIVFCWKHCRQVLTKVVSESLFFVLLWGCDVIEWFSIFKMEKTTGNTWKYDIPVDPMTHSIHSRQRTLKDTVVPWGCGRSWKTCWVARARCRGSDHRSSMFNEAMRWNKFGFLALLAVRNCSRWVTKNRGTGHRALKSRLAYSVTRSMWGKRSLQTLCDAATVLFTLLKGSYFMILHEYNIEYIYIYIYIFISYIYNIYY